MLSDETKKRIFLIIFAMAAVIGIIFLIFAVFLNRGTLTFIAPEPYIVTIGNFKTVSCTAEPCSETVAPGDYNIVAKKEGYKDFSAKVTVPIGGELKETLVFEFLPSVQTVDPAAGSKLFEEPRLPDELLKQLPTQEIFYDKNYIVYLAHNKDNGRQTLYVRTFNGSVMGDPAVAASFMRDLKNYKIIPDIEQHGKIAVIDSSGSESILYIVDLKTNTRENILSYPIIEDVKWLPESDDFIFQVREDGSFTDSLFLYGAASKQVAKLDLITSLKDVAMVSKNRIVAATNQFIASEADLPGLEGTLVVLTEQEATPSAGTTMTPVISFVDVSLVNFQSRLIKSETGIDLPASVKLSGDGKTIYFTVGKKIYGLNFSD